MVPLSWCGLSAGLVGSLGCGHKVGIGMECDDIPEIRMSLVRGEWIRA